MADLLIENKKNKYARSLADYQAQLQQLTAQIKAIKTNLVNLKSVINADSDFDLAAEASVQKVIDELATDTGKI